MLSMSDTPINQFIPFFAETNTSVAFLVPTPTGYEKSIMNATKPLRELLKYAGVHDYEKQSWDLSTLGSRRNLKKTVNF